MPSAFTKCVESCVYLVPYQTRAMLRSSELPGVSEIQVQQSQTDFAEALNA